MLWPAPMVATIEPSALIEMLVTVPAGIPFWVIDDVAEGDANPVSSGLLLALRTFQLRALAVAPLVQAGVVIATFAGAPPSTATSVPVPSNERLPVASWNGVPAVPPVTSAPSTVSS